MFAVVCVSLLLVHFAVIVTAVGDVSRCPGHLVNDAFLRTYAERCYRFVTFRNKGWDSAQLECRSDHVGRLADIPDEGVQDFIYNTLKQLGFHQTGVWIGLTDKDAEGQWKWTSGRPVNYTNWAPGQPGAGHSFEDCALLKMADKGKWHDYTCDFFLDHFSYVCVYDMLPSTSTTTGSLSSSPVHPSTTPVHSTKLVTGDTFTTPTTTPQWTTKPATSKMPPTTTPPTTPPTHPTFTPSDKPSSTDFKPPTKTFTTQPTITQRV